ncbi:MAG: WGR domain-containing protein [Pseudomonadota bacterium]
MHLTKIEPQANQYRFYRMEIVPGLFGDCGLVRNCGRIGSSGQLQTD